MALSSFGAEIYVSSGVSSYHFDYKEDLPFREDTQKQLKSTEAATVMAPFVKVKYILNDLGGYLIGQIQGGSVASYFDGTTLNGDPVVDTNYQIFIRGEVNFFKEVSPFLYAYAGLGYSYWNRFLSGGPGYREIYTWGYIPLGVRYDLPLSKDLLWSLDFSYRMMFGGQVVVIFSETVAGGDDTTLTLGSRPGYKLQSPFEMILNPNWKIFFGPWHEVSEAGASNFEFNQTVNSDIQVPDSKTVQTGMEMGAMYRF